MTETNPQCRNCPHHRATHLDLTVPPPRKPRACQHQNCPCRQYQPEEPDRSYQIALHTDDYRGDHSAEVAIAIPYYAEETIDELATRIARTRGTPIKPTDQIIIREQQFDDPAE